MKIISWDIGTKNFTYVIVEKDQNDFDVIIWDKCPFKYDRKGPQSLIKSLYSLLDTLTDIADVDKVIIEKQPAKNGIMTAVQNALISYYMLKYPKLPVELIHSNKKFAVKMNGKKNYHKRKCKSIEICREHIKDKKELFDFFETIDKKDDYADCLNLALL